MGERVPRRVITAEQLASIGKTNPIEAALAQNLIERGLWTLKTDGGETLDV